MDDTGDFDRSRRAASVPDGQQGATSPGPVPRDADGEDPDATGPLEERPPRPAGEPEVVESTRQNERTAPMPSQRRERDREDRPRQPRRPEPTPSSSSSTGTQSRSTGTQPTAPAAPARTPITRRGRRPAVVRKVDPWSVLKLSLVFYFCVLLVFMAALAMFWAIVNRLGLVERLLEFLAELQLIVTIQGGMIARAVFLVGLLNVILWSGINVFLAFLYNLIADLVGGLRVTVDDD